MVITVEGNPYETGQSLRLQIELNLGINTTWQITVEHKFT